VEKPRRLFLHIHMNVSQSLFVDYNSGLHFRGGSLFPFSGASLRDSVAVNTICDTASNALASFLNGEHHCFIQ
jgi:hypothetical protein